MPYFKYTVRQETKGKLKTTIRETTTKYIYADDKESALMFANQKHGIMGLTGETKRIHGLKQITTKKRLQK